MKKRKQIINTLLSIVGIVTSLFMLSQPLRAETNTLDSEAIAKLKSLFPTDNEKKECEKSSLCQELHLNLEKLSLSEQLIVIAGLNPEVGGLLERASVDRPGTTTTISGNNASSRTISMDGNGRPTVSDIGTFTNPMLQLASKVRAGKLSNSTESSSSLASFLRQPGGPRGTYYADGDSSGTGVNNTNGTTGNTPQTLEQQANAAFERAVQEQADRALSDDNLKNIEIDERIANTDFEKMLKEREAAGLDRNTPGAVEQSGGDLTPLYGTRNFYVPRVRRDPAKDPTRNMPNPDQIQPQAPTPEMVAKVQNLTAAKAFALRNPGVIDPQAYENPDAPIKRTPTSAQIARAKAMMGPGGYRYTSRFEQVGGNRRPEDAMDIPTNGVVTGCGTPGSRVCPE